MDKPCHVLVEMQACVSTIDPMILIRIYHPFEILIGLNKCFYQSHGVLYMHIIICTSMNKQKISLKVICDNPSPQ